MNVSVSAVCTASYSEKYTGLDLGTYRGTPAQISAHKAYRWARVAAELGDAEAQETVGADLIAGKDLGWMSDINEGLKWLNRSAQHGCFDAFYFLSLAYEGTNLPEQPVGNLPQDYVQALKWLDITISRKEVKECNMFHDFYHGRSRNPADKDRDPLMEQYDLLVQKITPAQIAEAKKLAQEWKPDEALDRQAWGSQCCGKRHPRASLA